MGSIDDGSNHAKGEHPALNWVNVHIKKHNEACKRRAMAAPLRLRILAAFGLRRRYDRWQEKEPLHNYYEKQEPK